MAASFKDIVGGTRKVMHVWSGRFSFMLASTSTTTAFNKSFMGDSNPKSWYDRENYQKAFFFFFSFSRPAPLWVIPQSTTWSPCPVPRCRMHHWPWGLAGRSGASWDCPPWSQFSKTIADIVNMVCTTVANFTGSVEKRLPFLLLIWWLSRLSPSLCLPASDTNGERILVPVSD